MGNWITLNEEYKLSYLGNSDGFRIKKHEIKANNMEVGKKYKIMILEV